MSKILIECGHIYGFDSLSHSKLSDDVSKSILLGIKLGEQLKLKGHDIQYIVLHDEVIEFQGTINHCGIYKQSEPYICCLESVHELLFNYFKERGVDNFFIQTESAYIKKGLEFANFIDFHLEMIPFPNATVPEEGGELHIGKKKIRLTGYKKDRSLPTCEVMDYQFALDKKSLKDCDLSITVLPKWYEIQQSKLYSLLKGTKANMNMMTLFYDDDGDIVKNRSYIAQKSVDISAVLESIKQQKN